MKWRKTTISTFLLLLSSTQGFTPQPLGRPNEDFSIASSSLNSPTLQYIASKLSQSLSKEDCGCETVFSGKPTDVARDNIDHRNVIAKVPLFRIDGTSTNIDEIIGDANDNANEQKTSLVVFLRSLG